MAQIEGGCLCGKVRYSSDAEPILKALCHCTHCQKQSGATYSSNAIIPEEEFSVTGKLSQYVDTGESGKQLRRYFCPNCGSHIYTSADAFPGLAIIKTGSLDDASWFKPDINIWCRSAQPWVQMGDGMTNFEKGPE